MLLVPLLMPSRGRLGRTLGLKNERPLLCSDRSYCAIRCPLVAATAARRLAPGRSECHSKQLCYTRSVSYGNGIDLTRTIPKCLAERSVASVLGVTQIDYWFAAVTARLTKRCWYERGQSGCKRILGGHAVVQETMPYLRLRRDWASLPL